MKYRTRTFYTDNQKSEMWDRWQRGESMSSIGRCFNRASSSIFPHLAVTGGIRPPARTRSRLALTLMEREENSRGLASKSSLRAIARVSTTIRRSLHEGPLLGNQPNFAKPAPSALPPFAAPAYQTGTEAVGLGRLSGHSCHRIHWSQT